MDSVNMGVGCGGKAEGSVCAIGMNEKEKEKNK